MAQVKPASSGQPSFYEPQMRRLGSGVYRPNAEQAITPMPGRSIGPPRPTASSEELADIID